MLESEKKEVTMGHLAFEYAKAVVSGVADGVDSIIDTFLHPLDNILYPITDLLYDSTVILAGHLLTEDAFPSDQFTHADLTLLRSLMIKNPQLYAHAEKRMQERLNFFKEAAQAWEQANGPQRVKILTSATVSILAPGWILKSTKVIKNLHNFGIPYNPPKFYINKIDDIYSANELKRMTPFIQHKNLSNIRSQTKLKNFMYVITEDNQLLISDHRYKLPRGEKFQYKYIAHPELAQLKPIYSSGHVFVEKGLVVGINEYSGHYQPFGKHLDSLVTRTFVRNGYTEAPSKFKFEHIGPQGVVYNLEKPEQYAKLSKSLLTIDAENLHLSIKHQEKLKLFKPDPFPGLLLTGFSKLNLEKEDQKQQAEQLLIKNRLLDSMLNPFTPIKPSFSPPMSEPFQARPYSWFYHTDSFPFSYLHYTQNYSKPVFSEMSLRDTSKDAMREEMYSLLPSFSSDYLRASSQLGMGYNLSLPEFRGLVSSTSLMSTYNQFNPGSSLRSTRNFNQKVGGVATQVGIIKDLLNDAPVDQFIMLFSEKKYSLKQEMISQIFYELHNAYFQHNTIPFFSLHFNSQGSTYPVIHPVFQNTLTGRIIALLDYWMKGVCHGVLPEESFIETWHKNPIYDREYLQKHMIGLEEYCNERHLSNIDFIPFREIQSKSTSEFIGFKSSYPQPYRITIRIIAFLEKIERCENVLIPSPNFRVDYTIKAAPDYKSYLEQYLKIHGHYPLSYQTLQKSCENLTREIKEKMPSLPFCRDYFGLLGVMSSFCYLFATLKQMGKIPVLESQEVKPYYQIPKLFPPIPVKYYKSYSLFIKLSHLDKIFSQQDNALFAQLFTKIPTFSFPVILTDKISLYLKKRISEDLHGELTASGMININEKEIKRISAKIISFYKRRINVITMTVTGHLEGMVNHIWPAMSTLEIKTFSTLNILDKIHWLTEKYKTNYETIKIKWRQSPLLATQEIFLISPKSDHKIIAQKFSEIEKNHQISMEKTLNKYMSLYRQSYKKILKKDQLLVEGDIEKLEFDRAEMHAKIQKYPTELTNIQNIKKQNISKAIVDIDQEIQAKKHELALIHIECEDLSKSPRVAEYRKNLSQDVADEAEAVLAQSYLQQSIRFLDAYYRIFISKLDHLESKITQFNQKLIADHKYNDLIISDNYIHEAIKFTDELTYYYGGCGIKLPNLESQPIEEIDGVREQLASEAASKISFNHNDIGFKNKTYKVVIVPVKNVFSAEKQESKQLSLEELSLIKLIDFCAQEPSVNVISDVKNNVDKSGATWMHYAATAASVQHIAQLQKLAPAQKDQADHLGNLPIHAAALTGNTPVVDYLIKQDIKQIESKNNRGVTPLILAIQNGRTEVVKTLLFHRADVNISLPNELFPLFFAIQNNHNEIAELLIQHPDNNNFNLSIQDSGDTALHLAIEQRSNKIAAQLIDAKASCDAKRKTDGYTPLHLAVVSSQIGLVDKMMRSGIPVDLRLVSTQNTSLHLAAKKGHIDMVQYLLQESADIDAININQETPLMLAIKAGQLSIAQILAKKCKVNLVNIKRQSSSFLAAQNHMYSVSDILIARGENPELKDMDNYNFIYHLIVQGEYYRLKYLIEKNVIDLQQKFHNKNLLTIAVERGQFLLVLTLQEYGLKFIRDPANPIKLIHYAIMANEAVFLQNYLYQRLPKKISSEITRKYYWELVLLALSHGSQQCAELLLKVLPITEADDKELLLASFKSQNPVVVDQIIKMMSDINQPLDDKKNTALHVVVEMGSRSILELLLSRGCDPRLINDQGKTCFHLAVINDDAYILKRLFKLTLPSDWPLDLWSMELKSSASVAPVLAKHKRRLNLYKLLPLEEDLAFLGFKSTEPKSSNLILKQLHFLQLTLSQQKQTSLMIAAYENNLATMQLLLTKKADIHALDHKGASALHYAIIGNAEAAFLLLADHTAFFNTPSHFNDRRGRSALHYAAAKGMLFMVRHLCERSNYTEAVDNFGYTALHMAAMSGQIEIVEYLIAQGFDIDQIEAPSRPGKVKRCAKRTALHLAAQYGQVGTVKKLLELGADPQLLSKQGLSFCEYAILSNKIEMLQFVQQLDFYHTKIKNLNLLHAAVMGNNTHVLCELILADTQLNLLTAQGSSVLHLAALYNAGDVANLLLKSEEIPIDLPNHNGDTALHIAALKGYVRLIESFILAGASLNKTNMAQETPLFLACQHGHVGVVRALLSHNANFSIANHEHITPLKIALDNDHVTIVSYLKSQGAPLKSVYSPSFKSLEEDDFPLISMKKNPAMSGVDEQLICSSYLTEDSKEKNFLEIKLEAKSQEVDKIIQGKSKIKELMNQEIDYFNFQKKSAEIFNKNYSQYTHDCWNKFLKKLNSTLLKKDEKFMLLKAIFSAFDGDTSLENLFQILDLSIQLRLKYGIAMFSALFDKISWDFSIYILFSVLQFLLTSNDIAESFHIVEEFKPDISQILIQLQKDHQGFLDNSSDPRDIDQTIRYFAGESKSVQFPLSTKVLAVLKKKYLTIINEIDLLKDLSPGEFNQNLKDIVKSWKLHNTYKLQCKVLAFIIEGIYRIYKIRPYDTQILALLGLIHYPKSLKGRIAQIMTGEGKSTIIAMLAAFTALSGKVVDVVTSSENLAVRDCKKYKSFFALVDLSVSHICCENPTQFDFNADIIYGTACNYQFTLLRDGLRKEAHRQIQRQGVFQARAYQVVIVDEADNLFLKPTSARIAIKNPKHLTWIYQPIYDFTQHLVNLGVSNFHQEHIENLRDYLLDFFKAQAQKNYISKLENSQLTRWLNSAFTAITAKIKNRDYVIRENKKGKLDIIIVDYLNTGRLIPGSRWQGGLHQFLQIKEKLSVTDETLSAASISDPTFFKLYEFLYGVTGSIGIEIERKEMQELFLIDSFDVPPHFPKQLELLPTVLEYKPAKHLDAIMDFLLTLRQKKCPVLVLFKSIQESEQFSQHLKFRHVKHYLLNENQREDEEYIVACGGKTGSIVIATNTAGRGTDFILSLESIKADGLHVIFTFYPENLRVETQGVGRCARLGQPGKAVFFLDILNDTMIKELLPRKKILTLPVDDDQLLQTLAELRTKKTIQLSVQRRLKVAKESLYFSKLQDFFANMRRIHKMLGNENFEAQLLAVCHSFKMVTETSSLQGNHWDLVFMMAEDLTVKRLSNIAVDWSGLITQFKKAYVAHIEIIWAKFYTNIQYEVAESTDLAKASQIIGSAYAAVSTHLSPYFEGNIAANIIQCLKVVLNQTRNKLQRPFFLNFKANSNKTSALKLEEKSLLSKI